jgi:hypothetical protein
VLVASIAAYLAAVRTALYRRIRCSWQRLVTRIDPGTGNYAAFRNAGVLLEMIDYAGQSDRPIDAGQAETLSVEARQVRLRALWEATPWA